MLSLKCVLGSSRNIKEFEYVLGMTEESGFRRMPQHCGFRSRRRGDSDSFGREVRAKWFYYSLYPRKAVAEREFQILHDSTLSFYTVNLSTGFSYDFPLPSGKRDDEINRDGSDGRMSRKEILDDEAMNSKNAEVLVHTAQIGALGVHLVESGQRDGIICKLLLDIGPSKENFLGSVAELRGYSRGWLGPSERPSQLVLCFTGYCVCFGSLDIATVTL